MKQIISIQNPLIKEIVQLRDKSRDRKNKSRCLIEGKREIGLALKGGYELETILFIPEMISGHEIDSLGSGAEKIQVSKEVYNKIAYRESTEGMIAIARTQPHDLASLELGKNPLILIAESPEKPGNAGAMLRTADAARVDAVIIADPLTDLYNPNLIRSSVGCLFTTKVATGTTDEIIAFLVRQDISIYCATLQDSVPYHEIDFTGPAAIVVGTESVGLTSKWREAATKNIIIPMQGEIDSMNVSVAAAILIFEAKRQRGFRL